VNRILRVVACAALCAAGGKVALAQELGNPPWRVSQLVSAGYEIKTQTAFPIERRQSASAGERLARVMIVLQKQAHVVSCFADMPVAAAGVNQLPPITPFRCDTMQ
jgi:hypothetical protein